MSGVESDVVSAASLPGRLLAYAVALAVFLLVPPTLHSDVGLAPHFTLEEAMDLLTPVVVIPLAWAVLDAIGGLRGWALVTFLVIAAFWIEGQGIHLAGNALGDVFDAGAQRDAFYATDAGRLDHFLDEDLGHWMWHLAWVALSALMFVLAMGRPRWSGGGRVATIVPSLWPDVLSYHDRGRHGRARDHGLDRPARRERLAARAGRLEPGLRLLRRGVDRDAPRRRRLGRAERRPPGRATQRARVLSRRVWRGAAPLPHTVRRCASST